MEMTFIILKDPQTITAARLQRWEEPVKTLWNQKNMNFIRFFSVKVPGRVNAHIVTMPTPFFASRVIKDAGIHEESQVKVENAVVCEAAKQEFVCGLFSKTP